MFDWSTDESRSLAPTAWPHDRSESQHTDDDHKHDQGHEQHDRSTQFAYHKFLLFN